MCIINLRHEYTMLEIYDNQQHLQSATKGICKHVRWSRHEF